MTVPQDTPDWSLLPGNPAAFFGLSGDFDRKQLKRSYNKLIRRFKPERNPDEFQRIRAAFEQLDLALRYGGGFGQQDAPTAEYQWQTEPDARGAPDLVSASVHSGGTAAGSGLIQRMQQAGPQAAYRELVAKPMKSPYDFYALAVMSDIVDRKDGLQFARWLIKGLGAHRDDPALNRLLYSYLNGPLPEGACAGLLVALSKALPEDSFFPVTEPLWKKLVAADNFSAFRDTLRRCESNMPGVNVEGKLVFYVQILKSALWQADPDWSARAMEFVEANFERIPYYLDFDVEILDALRNYLQFREHFVQAHSLRSKLDAAMRTYFTEDQASGDRAVLKCQMAIAHEVESLGAAFADLDDTSAVPFLTLWTWISYDVAERLAEQQQPAIDENVWYNRTIQLLEQLNHRTSKSGIGRLWDWSVLPYRVVQAACYVIPPVFLCLILTVGFIQALPSRYQRADEPYLIMAVASVVGGLLLGHWLKKKLRERFWSRYCQHMAAQCYHRLWRTDLLEFLGRSHLPPNMFLAFISDEAIDKIPHTGWLKFYASQDAALPLYAMAQRFVV